MTSGETSHVKPKPQKADVIAVLKETCRELEARKKSLEELIATLEREQDTDAEDERPVDNTEDAKEAEVETETATESSSEEA